jgi:hypothetical protein
MERGETFPLSPFEKCNLGVSGLGPRKEKSIKQQTNKPKLYCVVDQSIRVFVAFSLHVSDFDCMILMVREQLGTQLEWIFYSMVCFLVFHFESRIFTMSLVIAGRWVLRFITSYLLHRCAFTPLMILCTYLCHHVMTKVCSVGYE